MKASIVDLKDGDLDLYVDGQLVLHICQVSDEDIINLFFYPGDGEIVESMLHEEDSSHECTHELLCVRKEEEREAEVKKDERRIT